MRGVDRRVATSGTLRYNFFLFSSAATRQPLRRRSAITPWFQTPNYEIN